MVAEARTDVQNGAPRCLLGLFDAAATGLADRSEFYAEAERLNIEVRMLSSEDLAALIEGSTRDMPTTDHRILHQRVHMAAYHSVLRFVAETEQEVGKKGISDPISMPS